MNKKSTIIGIIIIVVLVIIAVAFMHKIIKWFDDVYKP